MWRHKLVLIAPALVFAVSAGAALRKLPDRYESSAKVELAGEKDPSKQRDQLRQLLTDRDCLTRIKEWLPSNDQALDDFIAQAREDISVELDASPDSPRSVFTVSYRSADPETARRITEELAERIIAKNSELSKEDSELTRLNAQANEILRQLHAFEETHPRLPLRADGAPVSSMRSASNSAEAAHAQEMTVESIKDQQYKLRQELTDVERRIAEQRLIVEQQKKGSGLRDNPTYAALVARKAELQGQRDTLINRQELTDKHPRVLAINDQITAIDRQVEELRRQDAAQVAQSPEARELSALERERNRLKLDLEVTGRELARQSANATREIPTLERSPVGRDAPASKLGRRYLDLERAYSGVKNQIELTLSKNPQALGGNDEQPRLLAQASLPKRASSPNRPLLTLLAAAVGLALGAIFTIFAESRRFNSLQDAGDVERHVRLTVLASIPRTATAQDRRRARWRAMGRLVLGTAFSVVATFALGKLFIISNLFALITRR